MFPAGSIAALLFLVLLPLLGLWILYVVIRLAVRDGMRDALRRDEAERVRAAYGLGPERSPNQSA